MEENVLPDALPVLNGVPLSVLDGGRMVVHGLEGLLPVHLLGWLLEHLQNG